MQFKKKKTKKMPLPSMLPPPYIWDVYDFPFGVKNFVTEIEADTEKEARELYSAGAHKDRLSLYKTDFEVNLKKTKDKLEQIEKEKQERNRKLWWNND